jgi:flagellar hook assembly protein FlgD
MYGPALGSQSVTFDLTTYQSQAASVSVSFFNQSSSSTLRTMTIANQAPGPVTISWDGRAENGMWVAPGTYTITATVTDTIGNVVSEQLLTTIQY